MNTEAPETLLGAGQHLKLLRRNRWEFVDRPTSWAVAVLLPVTAEGKLVFVEQYREPVRSAMIEFPAGLVGDDEGVEDEGLLEAANRELIEETGYRAGKLSIVFEGPPSGGLSTEIVTFVRADQLERVGDGGGVGGEEIKVHLVAAEEADAWLEARRGEGFLIDVKVYSGLYFLGRGGSGFRAG